MTKLDAQIAALEAEIRDRQRLGQPTGALQEERKHLLALRRGPPAPPRAAIKPPHPATETRWHREHYHRRDE